MPASIDQDGTYHRLRPTFQSPWSEHDQHIGKRFSIVAMIWTMPDQSGWDHPEAFWHVKFEDGAEIRSANTEEIFEDYMADEKGISDET